MKKLQQAASNIAKHTIKALWLALTSCYTLIGDCYEVRNNYTLNIRRHSWFL